MKMITVEQAIRDLRADPDICVDELDSLIERASAIVLDYLKKWPPEWAGPDNIPLHVQTAVSMVLIHLDENRFGDPITDGVRSVLMRSRDPACA